MIKLPKEIRTALKILDEKGFDPYVAGSCVLEALTGEEPYYWTLLVNGERSLAQAAIASEMTAIAAGEERELTVASADDAQEWLKKQPFTLYALADHPEKGFLDPLNGRADMKKKLIRATSPAKELFQARPELVLEALCLVAELDYDVELDTFHGMQAGAESLMSVAPTVLRDQFARLLTGPAAAKALRLSAGCGALRALLGEECYPPKTKYEGQQLETLLENLDLSKAELEYRYALLFLCLEKPRAMAAIERLEFDPEFHQLMISAVKLMDDLYFASDKNKFKPFLAKIGRETYEYLHAVSKQQRKVYDLPEYRIKSRIYMVKEYEDFKIPVFVEDLAIQAEDLVEVGITETAEAEKMLLMLLDVVHKYPRKNTRPELLKRAREFRKNPLKVALRGVRWIK